MSIIINKKEELIIAIKNEIPFVDIKPYSHNIIGLKLELLEKEFGEKEVIELIKNTNLKYLGWGYILI
tara:strand:+ start:733 stop:936 length:204 start_codon:yes stop_codon:yes gene_type:complete